MIMLAVGSLVAALLMLAALAWVVRDVRLHVRAIIDRLDYEQRQRLDDLFDHLAAPPRTKRHLHVVRTAAVESPSTAPQSATTGRTTAP